jgi:sulfatase modifying factor 1
MALSEGEPGMPKWAFGAIAGLVGLGGLAAGYAVFLRTDAPDAAPIRHCPSLPANDRIHVPAGRYEIGAAPRYSEETGPLQVETAGFWIDRHEVTNAQFARFVAATGYRTIAEQSPDPQAYPDIDPAALVPGSAVFGVSAGEGYWWSFVPGASWQAPYGPGSSIEGMEDYPVIHIAYADARAYAAWSGVELPTETEWEIAARAGQAGAEFEWGDEFRPGGQWRANTWQGPFPVIDTGDDGFAGPAPAGCFEPNALGLLDMTGNVWEWTSSPFSADPATGTIRGGSYLCAPNYCARFRPAARQAQEWDFSASHIGFRTISREPAEP